MLGKRLAWLRGSTTQEEVAHNVGISRARYSHYETGRSEPDATTLCKLAEYYNCSLDYLLGLSDVPLVDRFPAERNVKLPILGSIRTDLPVMAVENISGYLDVPEYLAADFLLRVNGDSMIGAGILDGDLALCKESKEFQSGDIVAVRKNISTKHSELSLKYYLDIDGHSILKSANPNYPDVDYLAEGYTAIGHLAALVRREAPGYEIYTDYLTIKDNEEWTEVIETAAGYGLTPQDILSSVNIQAKMLKRLRGT